MQVIPFTPAIAEYRFTTTLDGADYSFRVTWNERDEAWFFDLLDADDAVIALGVKIVLGTNLARTYKHPLVRLGAIVAIDRSGSGADATFRDLGTRVLVMHLTSTEMAGAIVAAQ